MLLHDTEGPLRRQIMAAIKRHVFTSNGRAEALKDIEATLIQLERDYPGLIGDIHLKLGDSDSYKGSREQRFLNMAIASVLGIEPGRSKGKRTKRLEEWDSSYQDCVRHSLLALGKEDDPSELLERTEWEERERLAVTKAIDDLPEEIRTILRAVYVDGKSQAEVARDLGKPTSTINDAIRKVIGSLSVRLKHLRSQGTDG